MPDDPGETEAGTGGAARNRIVLALIEHASRPAAYLLIALVFVAWLFSVRDPLFELLKRAQELTFGTFSVRFEQTVDEFGLEGEFKSLRELNEDQLNLFLILGRERKRNFITYSGSEINEENLNKLLDLGLLSEWSRNEKGGFDWTVSDKAYELHEVIFSELYRTIKQDPEGE